MSKKVDKRAASEKKSYFKEVWTLSKDFLNTNNTVHLLKANKSLSWLECTILFISHEMKIVLTVNKPLKTPSVMMNSLDVVLREIKCFPLQLMIAVAWIDQIGCWLSPALKCSAHILYGKMDGMTAP